MEENKNSAMMFFFCHLFVCLFVWYREKGGWTIWQSCCLRVILDTKRNASPFSFSHVILLEVRTCSGAKSFFFRKHGNELQSAWERRHGVNDVPFFCFLLLYIYIYPCPLGVSIHWRVELWDSSFLILVFLRGWGGGGWFGQTPVKFLCLSATNGTPCSMTISGFWNQWHPMVWLPKGNFLSHIRGRPFFLPFIYTYP